MVTAIERKAIVDYLTIDGRKTYDVNRALELSGWGIGRDDLDLANGIRLVDRYDPDHVVTIERIQEIALVSVIQVVFKEGGWLVLDNAINQFMRLDET